MKVAGYRAALYALRSFLFESNRYMLLERVNSARINTRCT